MIDEFSDDLESITLLRGEKGRFDVLVDGREVFSKHRAKRHANPGEIVESVRSLSGG